MLVLAHYHDCTDRILTGSPNKKWNRPLPSEIHDRKRFSVKVGGTGTVRGRSKTEPMGVGCCRNMKSRRLILNEQHFLDSRHDKWMLFLVKEQPYRKSKSADQINRPVLQLCLIPNTSEYPLERAKKWRKWIFVGECRASILRLDLEHIFRTKTITLFGNEPSIQWCIHMEVLIDQLIDREHLQSNRSNEKIENMRQHKQRRSRNKKKCARRLVDNKTHC